MTEPALVIEDLSVDYAVRGRLRPAVRSVSLTVAPGETVALVGESGSGKTTLAHAVMGLLPDRAVTRAARIDLAGHSLATAAERQWTKLRGRHVGLVPQDPTISLDPVQPIGRQVAEALRIHRLLAGDQAATATALLAAVGLEQPATLLRRYPHELSGGQRQRVLIAIALSCEPQLVIADEPTSGLDVTVQKTVLDHLQERTRALGVAVLLITHDLGLAVDRADRVVVMKVGQTVEQGPARSVLLYPAHPYTAMLAAAVPGLNSARARSRRRLATPTPADGPPLLEVRDLSKVFPGRGGHAPVRAVDHVSFAVHAGRTTALVGASGSGKTTAARLALALERPSGGTVHLDGHEATALRGADLARFRREVALVYQNPYASLNPNMTVGQIVEVPLRAFRLGDRAERQARVAELLAAVALPPDVVSRPPTQLSGGQRQRVAIARALAPRPRCVVLDEPVSALDVSVQAQILDLLNELQAEFGMGYLFISHDLAVVAEIADEVHVMENGRIVESGPAQRVLTEPTHPYTRTLLEAVPGTRFLDAWSGADI